MTGSTTVADIGERRLVELIASKVRPADSAGPVVLGIGDDAAVLRMPEGQHTVVSCDRVPEDLFAWTAGLITPYELGQYLVRVNISDLAAMGAMPVAVFWLLSLPAETSVALIDSISDGVRDACSEFGAVLAGGDSKQGGALSIGLTAIGSVPPGTELRRSSAKPGEDVFCTGLLGLTAAALAYYRAGAERKTRLPQDEEAQLRRVLWAPTPQLAEAVALRESGACGACIDNTDGIARSLYELNQASGVGLEVDAAALPLHPLAVRVGQVLSCDPVLLALSFGLDLSLIGTLRRGVATPHPNVTRIGVTTPEPDRVAVLATGDTPRNYLADLGPFEHFREPFDETIRRAAIPVT